jgi:hypothetical protein
MAHGECEAVCQCQIEELRFIIDQLEMQLDQLRRHTALLFGALIQQRRPEIIESLLRSPNADSIIDVQQQATEDQ